MFQSAIAVSIPQQMLEFGDPRREFLQGQVPALKTSSLRMARDQHVFIFNSQLLYDLFAWPRPRETDLDIVVRLKTGEPDHVASQVHNLDWRPHIEHENFRALPHGGR